MIYARKKDTVHNEIVRTLRGVGAEVAETYQFPAMLDVIVGYRGKLYWADLKTGKGALTESEQKLFDGFARVGITLHIWRSADEALRAIGAIR
jgi:hypothetical protein